ncbi:MAG TPA: methylmalonyl-CoA mutase family protein, partial [Polyangia bacterium]|nr:methylmalonyl-CoA mutase family protein [Polyangia bacterium]
MADDAPKKTAPVTMRETQAGLPLDPVYGPSTTTADYAEQLGDPGQFPFTRGPHASMYRGKPWTMRMFSGFGAPEDTNRRFKFLLAQGQTGLSTAFDMPTLMGFDPDDAKARGEVGREGVSVASVADVERLFDGIALDAVTTSMTINAPAVALLAFYVVAAERRGIAPEALGGTLQNDMLKEFIAQKEWICGVRPHLRIVRDMLVYCTARMPRWNT